MKIEVRTQVAFGRESTELQRSRVGIEDVSGGRRSAMPKDLERSESRQTGMGVHFGPKRLLRPSQTIV